MSTLNGALPRLTVPVYLLIGELTRVSHHDDGYLIASEKVIHRVELSVGDPWTSMGFGFTPNLKAQPVVPTQFDSTLVFANAGGSFVRADTLTDEETDSFELCIQEGPFVEWRIEPPFLEEPPMPAVPLPTGPPPSLSTAAVPWGTPMLAPGKLGWNNVPILT